jgi:transposase-like protein
MTDGPDFSTDQARRPRPVTDELRAQVVALFHEGLSRNAIARQLEVAGATVTKICQQQDPPLVFDRAMTALAVMAHQIDMAEARATLARSFTVRAQQLLDSVDEPVLIGNFGGRDNTWNETLLEAPTLDGKRTLVAAAATAARAASELSRADLAHTSTGEAVGMLTGMAAALNVAAATLAEQGELPDPTITPDQK